MQRLALYLHLLMRRSMPASIWWKINIAGPWNYFYNHQLHLRFSILKHGITNLHCFDATKHDSTLFAVIQVLLVFYGCHRRMILLLALNYLLWWKGPLCAWFSSFEIGWCTSMPEKSNAVYPSGRQHELGQVLKSYLVWMVAREPGRFLGDNMATCVTCGYLVQTNSWSILFWQVINVKLCSAGLLGELLKNMWTCAMSWDLGIRTW